MKQEIRFMVPGSGRGIETSCYYLGLGDANILLDAGIGQENGTVFGTDINSLITSSLIQNMEQIHQIYISHAHLEHSGDLLGIMSRAFGADVYMTEITSLLLKYQLNDRSFLSSILTNGSKRLAAGRMLDKITTVGYMQTMDFGIYKVTFLPAGHIPGAVMLLFEYDNRKILYTGGYSLKKTPLTRGCVIPEYFEIDTLLMCAPKAKHMDYTKNSSGLMQGAFYAMHMASKEKSPVMCRILQLSKEIEFLKILKEINSEDIPIYLDPSVMRILTKMDQLSVPVRDGNMKVMGEHFPKEAHIYVTLEPECQKRGYYREIKVDFSMYDDFEEMKEFIRKVNPKQVVFLHANKEDLSFNNVKREYLMEEGYSARFVFAEEAQICRL